MLRRVPALLLLALLTLPIIGAGAAPPKKSAESSLQIEGETVLIVTKLPFRVVCPEPADLYFWRVPPAWKTSEGESSVTVSEAPEGSATVGLQTIKIDWEAKKTIRRTYSLVVNVGKVEPVPPIPPGPTPPVPPGPVSNLRVLIVFDPATVTGLPAAQQAVLYGKAVRDALDAATPAEAGGKVHQWRIWPTGADVSRATKAWQDVYARPRATVPWVVIAGDGGVAYEAKLPATSKEMLDLLSRYTPKTHSHPMRKAG